MRCGSILLLQNYIHDNYKTGKFDINTERRRSEIKKIAKSDYLLKTFPDYMQNQNYFKEEMDKALKADLELGESNELDNTIPS